MTEATSLRAHAFVLAVLDLDSSVSYFVNALGFRPEWRDGDDWQSLVRGEVRLMLGHCLDAMRPADLGDHSYPVLFTTALSRGSEYRPKR